MDVLPVEEGGNFKNFLRRLFGASRGTTGFLDKLTKKQRPTVGNLNPMIYQIIIQEKKSENPPALVSTDEAVFDLLRKLSVDEIAVLSKSVECAQRGDSAASAGNFKEAAKHYRDAFKQNPYNDLALMSYGVAIAQLGQLREGITWVKKAVKVNPGNERARNNLKAMQAM